MRITLGTALLIALVAPLAAQDCFDYASGETPPDPGVLSLSTRIGDVAVAGDRLAVACFEYFDAQRLHVYWLDCSAPASPALLGEIEFGGGGLQWDQRVRIAGDRVYLNRSGSSGVVYCLDFGDPAAPEAHTLMMPTGYPSDIAVVGDVVWLACGAAGLQAWDFADPESPQPLGELTGFDGSCKAVESSGDLLAVATATTLYVVDGQDPTSPDFVGSVAAPSTVSGRLTAHGDHVYFVGGALDLYAADLSDPTAPVFTGAPLASRPGAWGPGTLAILGERLYHADGVGVRVIDIADPDAPAEVGALDTGDPMWLAVRPGGLYFADYNSSALEVALPDCAGITPVEETPLPARAGLSAYPNPFNPRSTIRIELPEAQPARVTLHDVEGRLLRELANREFTAGAHELIWRGEDERGHALGSGVYLLRLQGSRHEASLRLVMLR